MRAASGQRVCRRGSAMILFTLMLTCLIIPLAGLAIDVTKLYIVQAKLSAAVDGAALGAGRLLGTKANIQEIALEFLKANFPQNPKYWGSTLSEPALGSDIRYWHPSLNTHEIDITARADVPLWFLPIIRGVHSTAPVSASATATRRDTRIVVVLDRSYSMYSFTDPAPPHNTIFAEAISSAKTFTDMFTAGTDELGLIFFGSSAIVAYPNYTTRPYDGTPTTHTGGPDTGFLTANATPKAAAQGPMMDMLTAVKSYPPAEYTGMAEGLSMAYIELMRGHNRAVATIGSDDRLNAIVLMTDGVPTTISVYINNPASNSLKTKGSPSSATKSPCTNNPATATVSTQMIGSIGVTTPPTTYPTYGTNPMVGLYQLAWNNTGTTLNWVQQNVTPNDSSTISPTTPTTSCATLAGHVNYQSSTQYSDLRVIPAFDYWGNSTTGVGGHTQSDIVQNGHAATPHSIYAGTNYDATQIARTNSTSITAQSLDAYQLQLAIWNSVDAAGLRIRTVPDPKITIYTIGYEGTQGVDQGLLKRVANDQTSTSYVAPPTQEQGMYVRANNAAELHAAFVKVASELLRLAK